MNLEKQTNLIIVTDDGNLEVLHIAGDFKSHHQCSANHDSITNDRVFWHKSDMNHTKVEGVVIEWQKLYWDWSAPVGYRSRDVQQSEFFSQTLKRAQGAYHNFKHTSIKNNHPVS